MLRIGLMLDTLKPGAWVAKIIEDIQSSGFAQITLVVLNTPIPPKTPSLRQRLRNHWKLTLFQRYEQWDYRRNRSGNDAKASVDVSALLNGIPTLTVLPQRKGFTDRLQDEDVAAMKAADLDVVFRFGFRIIRGEVLNTAKAGVWSFHHDDNQQYRGGPPLFWEIYERNPVSGTILQILSDSLDGGRVLYRSHSATNFASLYLNRNPIYWKTAEFALRRLRDLHDHGFEYLQQLPTFVEKDTYTRGIYKTPDAVQMTRFLYRRLTRSLRSRIKATLHGNSPQWFLALRPQSAQRAYDDASGYQILPPPKDRFYADPFLYHHQGRDFLFFEDLRYAEGRALISCAEVKPNGELGEMIEVLRCPYHLSYPFVFEDNGEIYMIPETKQNRTVELYRSVDFPSKWTLDAVLLHDVFAVDATIHRHEGLLWMFVGLSNGRFSNSDELAIYYAESLRGPWTPHRCNPVVSDVRRARPAGALFLHEGKLIRPSQDCSVTYGYAINFNEVTVLNKNAYEEKLLSRIEPGWAKDNLGSHTYSSNGRFEVIDGHFAIKIK